ncbi:MAG: glycosyltransferase family 2 protein, partial [Mucilaginibacter sp.]
MDITVIIPAYNRVWALPKAIASCKADAGLTVQIIVVDDGSTDGTWEMLGGQTGIEIYKQDHWGKPWAVNMAFLHAKGKYIKFLDSDDWLVAGSLKKQFDLAEQEEADVVVAGYQVYNDNEYVRTQEWIVCDDFIAQNLGECDSSHYSAFLFKRDFIKDIPHRTSFASANFASRDDRCFMLEVALKEPKIAVMKDAALCHLHHEKGRLQFQMSIASACTNYQHLLIYKNILNQLAATG